MVTDLYTNDFAILDTWAIDEFSKQSPPDNERIFIMGALISYFWWGGQDPDAVNSISGLSLRDIHNIRSSWPKVSANGVESGTELLVRYFIKHPDARGFFKSFKDIPTEALKANRQFQAHCLNIISAFTSIIETMDTPELSAAICEKLGTTHGRRHVKKIHFEDLKDVLVQMFINDLHFNEATMQSWVRGVTFIYTNIFSKLDEATNH